MPYKVTVDGKKIIISSLFDGDIPSITGIRDSIKNKTKLLAIDEILVGDSSGKVIDIDSINDDELEFLLSSYGEKSLNDLQEEVNDAAINNEIADWPIDKINAAAKNMLLTTETILPDIKIQERLEVITAEVVYGVNIFSDFFSGVRDIVGGRSKAMQNALRDARKTCLSELRREGLMVGANAVIAIKLDYNSIGSKGSNMLMLTVSGTAVKLSPKAEPLAYNL